jgi:hypothetical protein
MERTAVMMVGLSTCMGTSIGSTAAVFRPLSSLLLLKLVKWISDN